MILKSLIEKESELPVPTFEKVFKFDISIENIERMIDFRSKLKKFPLRPPYKLAVEKDDA